MATIKKRADELQPGDVLPANPLAARRVVLMTVLTTGNLIAIHTHGLGHATGQYPVAPQPVAVPTHTPIDVEVRDAPPLTLAQQHAQELLEIVRETVSGDCTPETLERGRVLLDKIDPPKPVTLAELLAALEGQTLPVTMFPERAAANRELVYSLLARARRAGQMPEGGQS